MQALALSAPRATLRFHDLPGPGRPLVLVHGLGCASSCDYPRVVADPALPRRRCILVDLLGSGFSDKPVDHDYTVESQARTLLALIDSLGLPGIDLFGHSMGGSVAIALAGLQPGRVARLVLAEPNLDAGGGIFSRGIAAQTEAAYAAHGHAAAISIAAGSGNPIWAGSMASSSAVAVHRAAVSLVRGGVPRGWREQLLALPMPRTMLFGERSLPDPDTTRLAEAGLAVAIVPGAGHSMMWDNPGGLAQAIGNALA